MDKDFIPEELRGKDLYKILGINKKDINKDNIKHIIRKQYLNTALKLHPDKQKENTKTGNTNETAKNNENFNLLKSAYDFLSCDSLRKKYNVYILQNSKRKESVNNNTIIKRNIDKNNLLFQKFQKQKYKTKLEEREKASSFLNKPKYYDTNNVNCNAFNDLEKIKKENEAFLRKKQAENIKKKKNTTTNNTNNNMNEKGYVNKMEEMLEIYLDNYNQNIDLLKTCIEENFFFKFFVGFNFLDSSLHMNNEKDVINKKVGFILFGNRKEVIEAYIYYKKNIANIPKGFKLKLAVPCKGEKEDANKEKEKVKEVKENVDIKIEEMENELDKLLS